MQSTMESVMQNKAFEKAEPHDTGQTNHSKWRQLKQSISRISTFSTKDREFKSGINAWKALKEAMLKRKGLIEIGPQHANYQFTQIVMKSIREYFYTGIADKNAQELVTKFNHSCCQFQVHIDTRSSRYSRVAEKIKSDDSNTYNTELPKKSFKSIGFTAYAAETFEAFRENLGITNEDFINSLSPEDDYQPYLQYVANSKSSALFFFTYYICRHDRRFIIKTEERKNIAKFMGFLRKYMEHFENSPHSLLVKILGAYSIQQSFPRRKKEFFIIMQSIFWPSSGIHERYDLKGCTGGRKEDKSDLSEFNEFVMKDGNFSGKHINLGCERSWFVKQLSRDVNFLKRLHLMDYSLLIGIQGMNEGNPNLKGRDVNTPTFADLVFRVKRSSSAFTERKNSKAEETIDKETDESLYSGSNREISKVDNTARSNDIVSNFRGNLFESSISNKEKNPLNQSNEEYLHIKNDRRQSEIEVRSKRNSLNPYDHNTYEVHQPPPIEELQSSVLAMAEMPAPPPSALSVISPPNSSGSYSQKRLTHSPSTLPSSTSKHNKHKRLEIHKNISAVVKQLSKYVTKKKSNDVMPLETLPRIPTVSSQIDSKYLDQIDAKVNDVASNGRSTYSHASEFEHVSSQDSKHLSQNLRQPRYSDYIFQEQSVSFSNNNHRHNYHEISKSSNQQKHPVESNERKFNGETRDSKCSIGLDTITAIPERNDLDKTDNVPLVSQANIDSEIQVLNPENRRLLPNSANGTHIIEGPENRYYIGIIDIFTEYGFRQKVGRLLKTMKFCNCNHSSAPPDNYASRFTSFIERKLD